MDQAAWNKRDDDNPNYVTGYYGPTLLCIWDYC